MRMYIYGCMYLCVWVCVYIYMYTYVCIYVCVYILYIYIYSLKLLFRSDIAVYVCMYVCIYVCMYVCMYECMYVHTNVCMYIRMYVCINWNCYLEVTLRCWPSNESELLRPCDCTRSLLPPYSVSFDIAVFVGVSYFDAVELLTFEYHLHWICIILTTELCLSTCLRAWVASVMPKQGLGFKI